jgi:NAD(P)-dependent dehydrogenase (short-subunit alcohol dehydrogenase family)
MHREITALFDLSGKTALVTGGARTLGWDAACALAAAGCDVAVTSRSEESARESAGRLADTYGVRATGIALDQTSHADVVRAVADTLAWSPRIDILVNNAGGGTGSSPALLFERDVADIDQLIRVNLNGALYCCREVGRHMAANGWGKIVNIASIAGLCGRDRRMYTEGKLKGQPIDYAAAKAGVIGMTMDLAGYLSPRGVRVNAISPGGFERGQPREFIDLYSDSTPLGRMGRDGIDLKGAVLFLAAPASDYVTGQNLVVDGGFTIWH